MQSPISRPTNTHASLAKSAPASRYKISRGKDTRVRYLLKYVMLAVTVATVITLVQAQIASAAIAAPQLPPAAHSGGTYQSSPFPAPTPEDAYRAGLINRWQLEQLAGPLPQALQGPSVNGDRGGERR